MTYPITSSSYKDLAENAQLLAIGAANGSTIIFDTNLCIEKYILECHGGPVTSIDFMEDKRLITGSEYGSVYIHELDET
jgi:hypothetical protein